MGNKLEAEAEVEKEVDEGLPGHQGWEVNFEDLVFKKQIASGLFGKVYRGTYFATPVAIKELNKMTEDLSEEQTRKYIEREIAVQKNCNHPNIVLFMGVSVHESKQYIVMEYVPGGNLHELIFVKKKKLSWTEKTKILYDIALALNFMHKKGLIHRDLKPQNLLLTESMGVKLCDLGLTRTYAKKMDETKTKPATNSLRMTTVGSYDYMAPEVKIGQEYNEKVDVFGFGIVLGELITEQKLPIRSAKRLYAFSSKELERMIPPDCPQILGDLLFDCVEEFDKDRPSFQDILKRLYKMRKQLRREERKSMKKEHSKWKKREKKKMGSHRKRPSRAKEEVLAIEKLDEEGALPSTYLEQSASAGSNRQPSPRNKEPPSPHSKEQQQQPSKSPRRKESVSSETNSDKEKKKGEK